MAVCLSDRQASNTKTAESKDRSDILQPPIGALLLEGVTEEAVRAAVFHIADKVGPLDDATWGFYTLEFGLD